MAVDTPARAPRDRAVLFRTALPAIIAGLGFSLSFGWLWFPALSLQVFSRFPGVFTGTVLSTGGVGAFTLALLAGFIGAGIIATRLNQWGEHLAVLVLHGGALVLVAGGIGCASAAPRLAAALFGLAAAGPGVLWTGRLLRLPPVWTGVGIAFAAMAAWGASSLFGMVDAAALLPAGLVAAAGLAVLRLGPDQGRPAQSPIRSTSAVTFVCLLGGAFFAAGVVDSFAPVPTGSRLLFFALGMGIAAVCTVWLRNGCAFSTSLLAATAALAAAGSLLLTPDLPGPLAVLGGIDEGAALIALSCLRLGQPDPAEDRSGLLLAAILVVVNLGGAAGAAAGRFGNADLLMVALVGCACIPAAGALVAAWRRRQAGEPPAETVKEIVLPDDTSQNPVWDRLTRRESDVAELLIQDKSNADICAALFVSENTVRTHIKNIYHKTGAGDRDRLKALLRQTR